MAQGKTGAQLARELNRDPSVINREIARNGGRKAYSGVDAQARACRRPQQAARNKIADTPALLADVRALFATGATPKQIEVALRRRHGLDPTRRVSHETIYDYIYVHAKGRVKKELIAYLEPVPFSLILVKLPGIKFYEVFFGGGQAVFGGYHRNIMALNLFWKWRRLA